MTVPIRCVNTAEELAEYDAELAQDAQRQAEAEATQAHIARMCLEELDIILKHCDAARLDQAPHITCTNTADMVNRALAARPATAALAKTHPTLRCTERPHHPPATDQRRGRCRASLRRRMVLVVLLGPRPQAGMADDPPPHKARRRCNCP